MLIETGFGVSFEVIKHENFKTLTTIRNDLNKLEVVV